MACVDPQSGRNLMSGILLATPNALAAGTRALRCAMWRHSLHSQAAAASSKQLGRFRSLPTGMLDLFMGPIMGTLPRVAVICRLIRGFGILNSRANGK